MKRIQIMAGVLFLAALAITVVAFNANKPRLLILHSYDKDYSWTREVDVGLKRAVEGKREFSVRWFYMDTKRHPWLEFKVNAGLAAQKLVRSWQPTVVIAIDDDAQEYAMQYFVNNPEVKIVFAGVNSEAEQFGYDRASNVTGILERKPFSALKETLLLIAGNRNAKRPLRVMFLGDTSESVRQDAKAFDKYNWAPIQVVGKEFAATFDDWKKAVNEAEVRGVDIIITANYRKVQRDTDEKSLVPPRELVSWTEANARMPVIGTNAFYVEDGGMLAVATSPYEQGGIAMDMAMQILRKRVSPNSLPIRSTKQFVIAMRESSLQKRHIELPAVYEAAARASTNYYH